MADPIRLPNSAPKDLSTTKVTRTARQRFEKRQKRQQQKPEIRRKSKDKRGRPSLSLHDPGSFTRGSREMKDLQSSPRNRSVANPDRDQGNVIDVSI